MKAIVDGLAIDYRDQGQGSVILLLHGWAQTAATFDQLASELSASHRVIRPDLPGFGGSQRPDKVWGVKEYARFASNFLAKLEIDQLQAVAGHSFGGRVAIKAVAGAELTPDKLILIDAAGVAKSDNLRNKAFKVVAKTGKAVTSLPPLNRLQHRLRRRLYQAAGSTDYVLAGPMKDIFSKTITEDLREDTKLIAIPTLIIWGEEDAETPIADGRQLAYGIRGVRFETVPRAGHFVYLDAPDRVTAIIRNFVDA